jgi:hypothetical protein
MKTCGKCLIAKPEESFAWRDKSRRLYNVWCRDCSKAYDRNRYLTTDRPHSVRANTKKHVTENRHKISEYFKSGCVDCGNLDIRVLQFDHLNPEEKIANVGTMLRRGLAWSTIENEIKKCEIRCANCHMIRTSQQFNWWQNSQQLLGK